MNKEVKLNEDSYLLLINQVLKNKLEERELALDRYRKADENIQTNDHFMLLGKNAATFLDLASRATNDMASLAKEIKSIVFKETEGGGAGAAQSAEEMRAIIDLAKEDESSSSPSQPGA